MRATALAGALLFLTLGACHRSAPSASSDPAASSSALVDAGSAMDQAMRAAMADLPPDPSDADTPDSGPPPPIFNGHAADAGPRFHLQIFVQQFSMGRGDSSNVLVRVNGSGDTFAYIDDRECRRGSIGASGVAKIESALASQRFFDLPDGFPGPTDSGRTQYNIRVASKEKEIVYQGPRSQIGDERKRFNAVEDVIRNVVRWKSMPKISCPSNPDSFFKL